MVKERRKEMAGLVVLPPPGRCRCVRSFSRLCTAADEIQRRAVWTADPRTSIAHRTTHDDSPRRPEPTTADEEDDVLKLTRTSSTRTPFSLTPRVRLVWREHRRRVTRPTRTSSTSFSSNENSVNDRPTRTSSDVSLTSTHSTLSSSANTRSIGTPSILVRRRRVFMLVCLVQAQRLMRPSRTTSRLHAATSFDVGELNAR
jgi:hypothetical protein